jgi:hypothetical protein
MDLNPLLEVYRLIGEIQKSVSEVKNGQRQINQRLTALKQRVDNKINR